MVRGSRYIYTLTQTSAGWERVNRRRHHHFRLADFVQQLIGAIVLAAGVILPPDIWLISAHLTLIRVFFTIILLLGVAYLALYKADQDRRVDREQHLGGIPLRLLSLFIVSGGTATAIVVFFQEPSFYHASLSLTVKAILLTSVFTTISAAVADSVL